MSEERWLAVVGWEGKYEVSDLGNVRSIDHVTIALFHGRPFAARRKGKSLKPFPHFSQTGRLERMTIKLGSPNNPHAVHLLVLAAFVGPRPPGKEGAHGDGDPANNALDNLRWATPKENQADRARHGTTISGEIHYASKLTEADILTIRASAERRAILAAKYDVTTHTIGHIQRRKTWKHIA